MNILKLYVDRDCANIIADYIYPFKYFDQTRERLKYDKVIKEIKIIFYKYPYDNYMWCGGYNTKIISRTYKEKFLDFEYITQINKEIQYLSNLMPHVKSLKYFMNFYITNFKPRKYTKKYLRYMWKNYYNHCDYCGFVKNIKFNDSGRLCKKCHNNNNKCLNLPLK